MLIEVFIELDDTGEVPVQIGRSVDCGFCWSRWSDKNIDGGKRKVSYFPVERLDACEENRKDRSFLSHIRHGIRQELCRLPFALRRGVGSHIPDTPDGQGCSPAPDF